MSRPAFLHPVSVQRGEIVESYGFRWGPMRVIRMAHLAPRGYILTVQTDHAEVEIHVSERGRRMTVTKGCDGDAQDV